MTDLIYIVITLAFFAFMLSYVGGAAKLGARDRSGDEEPRP